MAERIFGLQPRSRLLNCIIDVPLSALQAVLAALDPSASQVSFSIHPGGLGGGGSLEIVCSGTGVRHQVRLSRVLFDGPKLSEPSIAAPTVQKIYLTIFSITRLPLIWPSGPVKHLWCGWGGLKNGLITWL